jgi:hypothetical protein
MTPLDEIPKEDLNEWGYPNEKWRFAGFYTNKQALKRLGVTGNKSFWKRTRRGSK